MTATFSEEQIKIIRQVCVPYGLEEISDKPLHFKAGHSPHIQIILADKESTEFPGMPVVGIYDGKGTTIESGHGVGAIDGIRDEIQNRFEAMAKKQKKAASAYPGKKSEEPAPEPKEENVMPKKEEIKKESNHSVCAVCENKVDENQILDCVMAGEQVTCKDCRSIEKPAPKEEQPKIPPINLGRNRRTNMNETKTSMVTSGTATSGYVQPKEQLSIEIIKKYICTTATDQEAYYFLQLCVNRGLNPFLKEAYLIKYKDGGAATMVVGKDAFTRKAEESRQLAGFKAGIIIQGTEGKLEEREGTLILKDETLVGGWARVKRKDMEWEFVNKVSLQEFNKNQGNWKTMPALMIRKCALVGCLREAFTRELGGCYDSAELTSEEM